MATKECVVTFPIVGSIAYTVEVDDTGLSKKQVIEAALREAYKSFDDDEDPTQHVEWDIVEHICEGNVCHAVLNVVEVEGHRNDGCRVSK